MFVRSDKSLARPDASKPGEGLGPTRGICWAQAPHLTANLPLLILRSSYRNPMPDERSRTRRPSSFRARPASFPLRSTLPAFTAFSQPHLPTTEDS